MRPPPKLILLLGGILLSLPSPGAAAEITRNYKPLKISIFEFNGRDLTVRFSESVRLKGYISYVAASDTQVALWGAGYLEWRLTPEHALRASATMRRLVFDMSFNEVDWGRTDIIAGYYLTY